MTKENLINLVNNKKPFETVYELKNETQSVVRDQIPSFEEFMKTYENNGNLNYDDLSGGSVGEAKGYGPVGEYSWRETRDGVEYTGCGQVAQTTSSGGWLGGCTCTPLSRFCLNIQCYNWCGDGGNRYACSPSEALDYAHKLEDNNWPNSEVISNEVLRKCATLVREAVRKHDREQRINGYVKVQGRFWGSYDWNYSY